jgi:translation elongation factor EF-G
MRTLRRLGIPVLIFINKIDRGGADDARVLREISARLAPAVVAMESASGLGTRAADVTPHGAGDTAFTERLVDLLADRDEALLAAYVDDEASVPYGRLRAELARQARRGLVHPAYLGSAMTGAGIDGLIGGIAELLPAAEGDAAGPVSGTVFKVDRGPAGEKVAYARLFSGTLRLRDRLAAGRESAARVTAISVFDRGHAPRRACVTAGQVAKLWGLGDIRIGDAIGVPPPGAPRQHFAPPTMETVVVPARRADRGALRVALAQLAEQDPLINLRQDDVRQEILVSLYGEMQKQVIQATLASDFGIEVGFRETITICIERLAGPGLRGHPHPLRVLAAAEPCPRHLRCQYVQHRRRLPQPDAARRDERPAAGGHQRARARAPVPARSSGRHGRSAAARARPPGGRRAAAVDAGHGVRAGGRHSRGADPRAGAGAAGPDPRRGRAGIGLRPVPAGPRACPGPAPL